MSTPDPIMRYAAVPHARAPLSSQEWLLVTRSGERHVMTADVLDALERMRGFATLEAHRQALLSAMPQLAASGEQLLRVLQGLVQRGLLSSEQEQFGRLTATQPVSQLSTRIVYFLSGRDPLAPLAALARELEGISAQVTVVVGEGVRAPALAELQAAAAPLSLQLLDQVAVHSWLSALGERVETGAGALALGLSGAEANLAQLLGAGGRVAWLDDRLHWPMRLLAAPASAYALDESSQRQVLLFDDHRTALSAGQPRQKHLQQLLQLCGSRLGAWGAAGLSLDPQTLLGRGLDELESLSGSSRIRSVVTGILGCAEAEHSLWMYLLDDAARSQMCSSRASYDRAIEAEAVAHGMLTPRLQRGGAYRPLLLDASQPGGLVPGSGRHSERVLHALGSYADPASLVAQTDALVGRSTVLKRSRAQTNQEVAAPSLNAFIADQALLRRAEVLSVEPAARLQMLASQLRDHARAPDSQRRAMLWEYLSFQQSQTIAALQQAIEVAGPQAPRFWHTDLAQIVQNHGKSLLGAKVARLAETPDDFDQSQASAHFAQLLEGAALKLELWPELWAKAVL